MAENTTADAIKLGAPPRDEHENSHNQLIASLRAQADDLSSQVKQLNGKLVQSYDRVSDLEDTVHVTSSQLRRATLTISQLEIERTQHLSALNTGLLVEKSTITAELTRLMERVTEETAHRGQAENAKIEIEKDLDDLSATLFSQANTMVAEARYSKSLSDRKADDAEKALKGTEEVIGLMQLQMQELRAAKEQKEKEAAEIQRLMGKENWVPGASPSLAPRLVNSHIPHQEFLLFLAHLRTMRISTETPPALSTLLPLPFITRLQTEDS